METDLLHDDTPGRHVDEPDETRPDGEGEEEEQELHPSGALVPVCWWMPYLSLEDSVTVGCTYYKI